MSYPIDNYNFSYYPVDVENNVPFHFVFVFGNYLSVQKTKISEVLFSTTKTEVLLKSF